MKLKFTADPKDWGIFFLFCVVLLYLVSLGIVNLASFAQTGELAGLNPLLAFSPEYLVGTIVVFIFVLAFIIMSCNSLIFDREKGIGIAKTAKKQDGYSKWEEDKEMKKELSKVLPSQEKADCAGIPLINNGKEIWVDNGEYHNLIIGSTGSGKTEMLVQPMVKVLAKAGESMIITDPKGEIYEKNANELREKGYNVVLLNFRNPQQGNSWNPLTLPYKLFKNGNKDKANELLDDLAVNILYDANAQNQDPFWEKTSADYFAGLALALFDDAKEEEINLNSINLMTTMGEEKCGHSTYIKEYFSYKDPASPAYIDVSSTLMAPNETKSSILSVFKQKIKLFSSRENLSEMLSHSDFDMNDIGRKKTAVFIVVQDEKKTYHSLVTIFIKQCYETLIDVAQESGGKLPFRTNFILDEFANMPPLKDVTTMVTAARSRKIRFSFIIQNFAQLNEVYGKENGETIKGNCGNIIYLISSELNALEEISKMCGEKKSKDKDKTASTPLITVSDLQRMPKWSVIVLRLRRYPFKTKLTPNWELESTNAWGRTYKLSTYPEREKIPVALFNIKTFVDDKKEDKLNQIMSNINSSKQAENKPSTPSPAPFMGGIDVNEFFKNVDAKLAEMEKEEKKDKEAKKKEEIKEQDDLLKSVNAKLKDIDLTKKTESVSNDVIEDAIPKKKDSIDDIIKNMESSKNDKKEEKTVNISKEDNLDKYNREYKDPTTLKEGVSDDQFFDDFFNDDDSE